MFKLYWGFVFIYWIVMLSSWIVSPESVVLNTSILVVGIILIFARLLYKYKTLSQLGRHLRITNVVNIMMTLFLATAIWSLANYFVVKKDKKFSISQNSSSRLSEQTQALLKRLPKTKITLLTKRERWGFFLDLLSRSKEINSQITVEAYDLDRNPSYIQKYKLSGVDALVLESAEKNKRVITYFSKTKKIEQTLVNALLKFSQDKSYEVYFSQGHGEFRLDDQGNQGLSYLKSRIQNQNLIVDGLDLSRSEIPRTASIFIIWGGSRPFKVVEITKIRNFLERGGQLLVALGPSFGGDRYQGLRKLLAQWDLKISNNIIIDKLSGSQNMEPTIVQVSRFNKKHALLSGAEKLIYMPLTSSIEITQLHPKYRALSLASSQIFPAVWAESNLVAVLKGKANFDKNSQDIPGALNVMATSQATGDTNNGSLNSIVLFGSSSFALNNYSAQKTHFQLILNSLSWQLGIKDMILKDRVGDKREPIVISNRHLYLIFYLTVLLLPLMALMGGIFFFIRRKNQ